MTPYYEDAWATILCGDALDVLAALPDQSVQCVVTSPPYFGLRDYGVDGQIGLENTPREYVDKIVAVWREVWRCLANDGCVFLNLGSSYASGARMKSEIGKQRTDVRAEHAVVSVTNGDAPFVLRDDLTPDELAYVFSELALVSKSREISQPDLTTCIDQTIAPLTDSEKV